MLPVTESGTWLVRIEALEIGATFHLGLQCGEVEQDSPEGCLSSSSPVSSAEPCPACVCAQDPFCCQIAWDGACVGLSAQTCSDSCECALPAGSCCFESDGPLCDEGTCVECVCALHPECCVDEWSAVCVESGATECQGNCSCAQSEKTCCAPHASASCENTGCSACVCGELPHCCEVAWDGACTALAVSGVCSTECPCESAGE